MSVAAAPDAAGWAARYEALRAQALGAPGATPLGLGLVVRRGVAAWLAASAACGPPSVASPGGSALLATGAVALPAEAVLVLANMALAAGRCGVRA